MFCPFKPFSRWELICFSLPQNFLVCIYTNLSSWRIFFCLLNMNWCMYVCNDPIHMSKLYLLMIIISLLIYLFIYLFFVSCDFVVPMEGRKRFLYDFFLVHASSHQLFQVHVLRFTWNLIFSSCFLRDFPENLLLKHRTSGFSAI